MCDPEDIFKWSLFALYYLNKSFNPPLFVQCPKTSGFYTFSDGDRTKLDDGQLLTIYGTQISGLPSPCADVIKLQFRLEAAHITGNIVNLSDSTFTFCLDPIRPLKDSSVVRKLPGKVTGMVGPQQQHQFTTPNFPEFKWTYQSHTSNPPCSAPCSEFKTLVLNLADPEEVDALVETPILNFGVVDPCGKPLDMIFRQLEVTDGRVMATNLIFDYNYSKGSALISIDVGYQPLGGGDGVHVTASDCISGISPFEFALGRPGYTVDTIEISFNTYCGEDLSCGS